MRCPRCRQDNPTDSNFCVGCGIRLALRCVACNATLPEGSRFCNKCGHLIAGPPTPTESRFAAPDSYTPKHLVEEILTSKAALEGERKQVTVLFADLKSSTELLADRDPEEARTLLDPVLEQMMEAVHRYEGTVNQVMGDGIMALFGAPLAHEDHAVRACYAALRMQASIKQYADGIRREHGAPIRIRVGLNSGEVVVRAIGSDLRMDYTAIGQTTHLAARMEQLADPGSILLTRSTLSLVEGFVQVADLGPMAVKGLPGPVQVYELRGISAARSRLQAAATRGLSRFVGRHNDIEQLHWTVEKAREGHGQVAAVIGEPGVGKSRLVFELTHSHRVEGCLVLESESVSYGRHISYLPAIDLLKAYFRIGTRDTYRDIREKVTGKILTLDRALEPTLPALLALLDVPVDDPQWLALDPLHRREHIQDTVKRLLLRESRVQPLVLVFEDLHWIDSETQAFLDSLVESLPTSRTLLLVSYRPEYSHSWGSKTFYSQLRLDTLPAVSRGEMLDSLLGPDGSLAPLKALLAARTEGNPLFIEESLRTLVETHTLLGERGAYRLARPVETVKIPATVQAILASRIDRLPPAEKRLLETAAVIGQDVPFALLQAIAGESEETLHHELTHLKAAEFLYETTLFPDLEYTFKHALTHEVAYGSLLQERRRAFHARIVDAIETLYPDRLPEHIERLANHAVRGEEWGKALAYLRQAGVRASRHSAYVEAVAFFEQALGVLKHLPESHEFLEQAIDIRLNIRHALSPLGRFRPMLDHLHEAERVAVSLDDQRRLGLVSASLSNYFQVTGDLERSILHGERAITIAAGQKDPITQASATAYLSLTYQILGDYPRAIALARESIALLTDELAGESFGMAVLPTVYARASLARALAEVGDFAEGQSVGEEAVRIAEKFNVSYGLTFALLGLGVLYLRQGHLPKAVSTLERCLGLRKLGDHPAVTLVGAVFLGCAYAESGLGDNALTMLGDAMKQVTAAGLAGATLPHAVALAGLGEAHLRAGRFDEAARVASQALGAFTTLKARGYRAWSLRLLGAIAARRSAADASEAEGYYQEARTAAEELGMRPLLGHCHMGLGELYRRWGCTERAHGELMLAIEMFRSTNMVSWAEFAKNTAAA